MADQDFSLKVGDLLPIIAATLKDDDGNAVDIEGATIKFHMSIPGAAARKIDATASNDQVGDGSDGTKGKVSYTWTGTDTDTAGLYDAEFEATIAGEPFTAPNDSHKRIRILKKA